ncbi:non-ribosomal peptide synthetase [Streptomyces hygroscopicus subsp. limoneus]|nr:non-ribosomal peptide synthetase [Streptomyces hygroscopicus subsp. limoneus]
MTTHATSPSDDAARQAVRNLLQGARAQQTDTSATSIPVLGRHEGVVSYSQERMWLLEQMLPGYNTSTVVRITGALDIEVLSRSFTLVAERHEVLRTVFEEHDGAPVSRVLPARPVPVAVYEPEGDSPADRYAAAVKRARELMREPFSLVTGPVFRVAVVRLSEEDALLVLVVHHIAIDGSSMRVLWSELSQAYEAFAAGRTPALPAVPVQYGDFAAWSREHQTPDKLRHQLDHWRDHLAGAASDELRPDRPRPAVRGGNGAEVSFVIDAGLGAAVDRFSQEHNATPFMTLIAAFSVVLARHSATDDVTVGTPIAGRTRPELDDLIGYFVNTLLLRTELTGDPSFADLLARTRRNMLAAYEHQELPFEALLDELQPERDPGRNPLFQVLFALGDEETDDLVLPGLRTERIEVVDGKPRFDLSVALTRGREGFTGIAYYDADLFEHATMSRLVRHFITFLRNAVADPKRAVSSIAMVDAEEQGWLLASGTGEAVEYAGGLLPDLIDATAARYPDTAAVIDADSELTYAQFVARANHLATRLREAGAGPDIPVGVWMDRSTEMAVVILAILKSGSPFLPLDPDLPVGRATRLLTDAHAPLICTDDPRADQLATTPDAHDITILRCGPGTLTHTATAPPPVDLHGDHLVSVYYTSGSTGTPKGVASTHTGWANRIQWMQAQYPLNPGEKVLHKTVLSFDDSAVEILWPLISGATIVMIPPGLHRDPRAILDHTTRHDIVALHFVPSMLTLFLDEITHTAPTTLRYVISSGEALRPDLVAKFHDRLPPHTHLYNQWGATEVSIDSTSHPCTPHDHHTTDVPLGTPIANNEVLLLDHHLNPVPTGIPGDLYLAGTGLARGYLGDPRKTATAFIPHPHHPGQRLYRTGDRGIRRTDNAITFLGRNDTQIKIRGIRIEPTEIEHTLRRHPHINNAVVTTWQPTPGDYRLAAYITTHNTPDTPDEDTLLTSINTHLTDQLPAYMIPSSITLLDTIPVNANGKTDHKALPQPQPTTTHTHTQQPTTDAEKLIATIWTDVLDHPNPDIHANFFALGGHSLLATRIISRLRTTLTPDIPLALIFDNPTIHTMAAAVAHLVPAPDATDERTPR